MEFFKKKSLLAMAAMFVAIVSMSMFVACGSSGGGDDGDGDTTDTGNGLASNEVLLDNFEKRYLDEEQTNEDFTNQNMIVPSSAYEPGTWYAYASTNGADVKAYDESGSEVSILISGSSDSASMYKTLGDGKMTAILDATSITGSDDYYASVVTPFLVSGDNAVKVNLSKLKSIKIKGEAMGPIFINIQAPSVVTDWANWGWLIEADQGMSEDISGEYLVSDMRGPDWKANPETPKADVLANAEVFAIDLATETSDRAEFSIDEIILVFEDEASAKAAF